MTFFDSSTPVPNGQDSPSVKAAVVPPESPSNQAARAEFEADPEKWLASDPELLTEYERSTLIQSLRHYFDMLNKENGPLKALVLKDVTDLQNKLLASIPVANPLPTVKTQLDRMESLLLELKAAVTFDAHLIGGYAMPPIILDDFDQALEDAKLQQEAAESAPELLTEEEIDRIYQSVSRDVERKEYDRLINKVIALNNYAKGVR